MASDNKHSKETPSKEMASKEMASKEMASKETAPKETAPKETASNETLSKIPLPTASKETPSSSIKPEEEKTLATLEKLALQAEEKQDWKTAIAWGNFALDLCTITMRDDAARLSKYVAWWYNKNGQFTEAIHCCDEGLKIATADEKKELIRYRAIAHRELGHYDQALVDHNTAKMDDNGIFAVSRAKTFESMKEYEMALEDWEEAARWDSVEFIPEVARLQMFLQHYDNSINNYRWLILKKPQKIAEYRDKIQQCENAKPLAQIKALDFEGAIRAYRQLLKKATSVPDVEHYRKQIAECQQRIQERIQEQKRAKEMEQEKLVWYWSVRQVCSWIQNKTNLDEKGVERFRAKEIDGPCLLLLNDTHLHEMGFLDTFVRLRLMGAINFLRHLNNVGRVYYEETSDRDSPRIDASKCRSIKKCQSRSKSPVEQPKAESKSEHPKIEQPKVESKVEASKVEASKVEAPKVEASKVEASKVDKSESTASSNLTLSNLSTKSDEETEWESISEKDR